MDDEIVLHWDEEEQCYLDSKLNPWFNGENIPCCYPRLFKKWAEQFANNYMNEAGEDGHIEMDGMIDQTLASLHPYFAEGIECVRSMNSIWYA